MTWDEGINGVHRQIAMSESRRIGILAGPGTGKTSYGLMRRVVRLLEEGVPGHRILLLSFTRVAAADLRDKIGALEAPDVRSVRATTLHGYCFALLQSESVLQITQRVPRILLDHERDLMLRDIGGDFGDLHGRRRCLEAFVAGWARKPDDNPGETPVAADIEFAARVKSWLRTHKCMLIGEVVPEAYRYLMGNPTADEFSAFDHILVDEYQDLNALEQHLLDVLSTRASLCIAGDDDQSIYSVRYANPTGILTFLSRGDVEPLSISTCGRCPSTILSMANSLIANAPDRNKIPLVALNSSDAGVVSIVQWRNFDEEVDGITAGIAGDIASGKRQPGEILVLTNMRFLGEKIRARLNELEIDARSFFTQEELESSKGREAIALLRLVVSRTDQVAMRVLVGLDAQDGRSEAYRRLLAGCSNHDCSPLEALRRIAAGEALGVNVPSLVRRYEDAVMRTAALQSLDLPDLIERLFPIEYSEISDLRAAALAIAEQVSSPAELLVELITEITQDEVQQDPDFVRVMSLHKSKGLTSPCVYLVGTVEGVIPTVREGSGIPFETAIAEGRRLFYVAVTRASSELVISSFREVNLAIARARGLVETGRPKRHQDGHFSVETISSRYISELGSDAPRSITGENWLIGR